MVLPGSSKLSEGQERTKNKTRCASCVCYVGAGPACVFATTLSGPQIRVPPTCDTPGTIASLRHFSSMCAWMRVRVCVCACVHKQHFVESDPSSSVTSKLPRATGTSDLDFDSCFFSTKCSKWSRKRKWERRCFPNISRLFSSPPFCTTRRRANTSAFNSSRLAAAPTAKAV